MLKIIKCLPVASRLKFNLLKAVALKHGWFCPQGTGVKVVYLCFFFILGCVFFAVLFELDGDSVSVSKGLGVCHH